MTCKDIDNAMVEILECILSKKTPSVMLRHIDKDIFDIAMNTIIDRDYCNLSQDLITYSGLSYLEFHKQSSTNVIQICDKMESDVEISGEIIITRTE